MSCLKKIGPQKTLVLTVPKSVTQTTSALFPYHINFNRDFLGLNTYNLCEEDLRKDGYQQSVLPMLNESCRKY